MRNFTLKKMLVAVAFATATNICFAQTPFDSFAPPKEEKPMLMLPEAKYRIQNEDSVGVYMYADFDIEERSLSYFDKNDSLAKKVFLCYYNSKWWSVDPRAEKYVSLSPYNFCMNNPILYIDPNGDTTRVSTNDGTFLFSLNDGSEDMTNITAKQLYAQKTQWFEPGADNYMALIETNPEIGKLSQLKHFTWNEVAEFAEQDRWMLSYQQGWSGDWKQVEEGADGYLMVTVDSRPYWADAVGQIPFAVDYFTDKLAETGDYSGSISSTIQSGQKYGEGKLIGGSPDMSNTYDNYFILRAANWAARRYSYQNGKLQNTGYNPAMLAFPVTPSLRNTYLKQ
ncbi:MAG: hypothetical protein JXR53_14340 [Bacteroidales bacterium]|nr:hypothetical protein [Bacteroidales bacterium]